MFSVSVQTALLGLSRICPLMCPVLEINSRKQPFTPSVISDVGHRVWDHLFLYQLVTRTPGQKEYQSLFVYLFLPLRSSGSMWLRSSLEARWAETPKAPVSARSPEPPAPSDSPDGCGVKGMPGAWWDRCWSCCCCDHGDRTEAGSNKNGSKWLEKDTVRSGERPRKKGNVWEHGGEGKEQI